jgi:hypothetical protein
MGFHRGSAAQCCADDVGQSAGHVLTSQWRPTRRACCRRRWPRRRSWCSTLA